MDQFKYPPLDLEKPAIRLLSLHPGNGFISCSLILAELHQRDAMISYEALSYTWGSANLTINIYVNGCRLKVTQNLYQVLLDLRYQEQERVLWIDAVCIDQGNNEERGHQVAQMGDIYKEADRVIFRLGLGSYAINVFMESLQWLQKESIRQACKSWSPQDDRWRNLWTAFQPVSAEVEADLENLQRQGLQEILEQPWFRRVWILQEVAFAKAGIISCGTKSVSARLFSLTPLLLGVTPDAHCQSVLDIMPSLWREFTWWAESRSLYKLLSTFGSSEATEPRDLIYALRGMSSDVKHEFDLFPTYGNSEREVMLDVIEHLYGFNSRDIKMASLPSSIRELARDVPRLDMHVCRSLAESSEPGLMEKILERPKLLASQEMIKVAAQHDKEGQVVEILLRYHGGEFKVDEEVLVCAAKNLSGAEKVFKTFWHYQNQLIITEKILTTAAENSKSGDSAMRFLLFLKTQNYDMATILETLANTRSEYTKAKMIRVMLQRKDNSIDNISKLLIAAAEIRYYCSCILESFVQETPDFEIAEHAIIAAMKNWRGGVDCLKQLLRYCPSYITVTMGIIQAARNSPDKGLHALRLLLQNSSVHYQLSAEERLAAMAQINDQASAQRPNPWETLSQEIVDNPSASSRESTLELLLGGKEGLFDEDTISSIVVSYGKRVVEDLFILRRKQAMCSYTCVRHFLEEFKAEAAEWRDMDRRYADIQSAGQFKSEEERRFWAPWIRSAESQRSKMEQQLIWMTLLQQIIDKPTTGEEQCTWASLLWEVLNQDMATEEVHFWRPLLHWVLVSPMAKEELRIWTPLLPQDFRQQPTNEELSTWKSSLLRILSQPMTEQEPYTWKSLLPQVLGKLMMRKELSIWIPLLKRIFKTPLREEKEEERRAWVHLVRPNFRWYLSGEDRDIWVDLRYHLESRP